MRLLSIVVLFTALSGFMFPGTPGDTAPPEPQPAYKSTAGPSAEGVLLIQRPDGKIVEWSAEEEAKLPKCSEKLPPHTTCVPEQTQDHSLVAQKEEEDYSDNEYWTAHLKLTIQFADSMCKGGKGVDYAAENSFNLATRILRWHGIVPKPKLQPTPEKKG